MTTTLTTARLILRPLAETDAARVERYVSDPDIAKMTLNIPHPYPEGEALTFIRSVQLRVEEGNNVVFAITEQGIDDCIGAMSVRIEPAHNRGELGYWIGKPHWGKGYATEAARAMLAYCFNELKLHKCMARAFAHNPASWRVMEKIGLKEEGLMRQHFMRDGMYIDSKCYGLLREEYLQGS
ncbi:GNAT family protein [Bacillus sp. FSL W7-1360]